jgi:hypothetical protein
MKKENIQRAGNNIGFGGNKYLFGVSLKADSI